MTSKVILAVALLLGIFSGAASWLLICAQRFGIQHDSPWLSFKLFWQVAHDPSLRLWAAIPPMIAFGSMMAVIIEMSDALAAMPTKRRGARLVRAATLSKLTTDRHKGLVQVTLGGIPLPVQAETSHTLLVGSTGTGKSNGQGELMTAALARGDRVIVVD